jgi:CRISPR-associated protein Csb3
MTTPPEATIRLRLNPTNPGQFFACCGILELADRAWTGAHAWFINGGAVFCVAPTSLANAPNASAVRLLDSLRGATLGNIMTPKQIARREELSAMGKRALDADERLKEEKQSLDELWRGAPLVLGPPFDLRLDWFTDDRAGGSMFKSWAGQQSVTDIAIGLKAAVDGRSWPDSELDWLSEQTSGEGLPFNFDSDLGGAGSGLDVGFSFDPLKNMRVQMRPLVELFAFLGLQRCRPQRMKRENRFVYSVWFDPVVPALASAVACGLLESRARSFEFRLLYRTKYLKSFLPAIPRGDQA